QPFDRGDLGTVHRRHGGQAGAARLAVDEHGARAAATLLAARLRARDGEILAQDVEQRRQGAAVDVVDGAVDRQGHETAFSRVSARRTSTGSVLRRYQADASASSCGCTSASAASPAAAGSSAFASAEGSRWPCEPAPVTAMRIVPSPARAAETAIAVKACVCGRSRATNAPAAGSS